jgi:hypothetical protein
VAAASPAAAPAAASPTAAPAETPADATTTKTITAAVKNIVACVNIGNDKAVVALFTPNMIAQVTGGSTNPYDAVENVKGLKLRSFHIVGVATYADGRDSAEVTYLVTKYQYVHERWWLIKDGKYWKLAGFDTLTPAPAGDTAIVGVQLGSPTNEYTIAPDTTSVTRSPVLIFHVANGGKVAHMLAVVTLPKGTTIAQVLADPSLRSKVVNIGRIDYLAPGEQQDLALVNLPAGDYTLASLFTAPDGKTEPEHGMVTTYTGNAPAA